eukprot:764472-Pleurochrysis_carterae.AAC.1
MLRNPTANDLIVNNIQSKTKLRQPLALRAFLTESGNYSRALHACCSSRVNPPYAVLMNYLLQGCRRRSPQPYPMTTTIFDGVKLAAPGTQQSAIK